MKTFVCKFKDGSVCSYITGDNAPPKGTAMVRKVEWSGPAPTREIIGDYITWMHDVTQQLANEWKITIMCRYMVSNDKLETWGYYADAPRKLIASTTVQ